jgi:phage terminase large subunit-like protein
MTTSFPARAKGYAARVLSGDLVAGKWVKAACARFVDDIARQESEWLYYFDDDAAGRVCTFVEMMPHVEGRWASEHIVIEDWQVFILCNLFGWLHKETKLRRFRRFYEEVARKNGKSPIAAAICLYLTFADGEPGAQVYSFATGKDQAKIVWKTAREMIKSEAGFASLGAAFNTSAIYSVQSASTFRPLAKNFGSLDGLNTHGFMADELHAQKERGLYDVMDSSTGARSQPLGGAITTAGSDRAGICYEVRSYVVKILNDVLHQHDGLGYTISGDRAVDDTWFGIIYTIDDDDDPFDESCWIKANPNLGVSVQLDDMQNQARKARAMASSLGEFLTKRLNVWVNADHAWMDMRAWEACANPALREEDFAGEECIAAFDLASKVDYAGKAKVFKRDKKYFAFTKFWLPERAVENSSNSQIHGWARAGWIDVTPGEVLDFNIVEQSARDDLAAHNVKEMPYDPWQATQFATNLMSAGAPMVEYRQVLATMSEPMKELERLVLSGELEHDGNPVMTWMISNVVCHRDAKDNIYPRKEKVENKIDGPVALIMALGRWLAQKPAGPDIGRFITDMVRT